MGRVTEIPINSQISYQNTWKWSSFQRWSHPVFSSADFFRQYFSLEAKLMKKKNSPTPFLAQNYFPREWASPARRCFLCLIEAFSEPLLKLYIEMSVTHSGKSFYCLDQLKSLAPWAGGSSTHGASFRVSTNGEAGREEKTDIVDARNRLRCHSATKLPIAANLLCQTVFSLIYWFCCIFLPVLKIFLLSYSQFTMLC